MLLFTANVIFKSSFRVTLTHPVMAVRVVIRTSKNGKSTLVLMNKSFLLGFTNLQRKQNHKYRTFIRLLASALHSYIFERHFYIYILSFYHF